MGALTVEAPCVARAGRSGHGGLVGSVGMAGRQELSGDFQAGLVENAILSTLKVYILLANRLHYPPQKGVCIFCFKATVRV